MRLILLGTQGWIPTGERETTCFAVEDGERLIVLDAGTGLRRLAAPPWRALVETVDEVHILLTHYHLDHVCGLAYLPGVLADRRVVLHAPAESVTGIDPVAALSGLVRPPYNPRPLSELPGVEVRELHEGSNEVAGHRVRVRPQIHSDTSVAYRLDDALVLATDTVADPETAAFAAGAEILLHEAWYAAEPGSATLPLHTGHAAHSEAVAAARIAAAAGVRRLLLIHLNPLADESSYHAMAAAARAVFAPTDVLSDGDAMTIGE